MTEPRDLEPGGEAHPHAEPKPEARPEVIQDLDVTGDDADRIAGGMAPYPVPLPYPTLPE